MKTTEYKVEYWKNDDNVEHIARCAKVCYATMNGKTNSEVMNRNLWNNGHRSMFRHATRYFIVPLEEAPKIPSSAFLTIEKVDDKLFISANLQWCEEHKGTVKLLEKFSATEKDMVDGGGVLCIRRTFAITTQISTSRELNRVSPNNIAEQSTRYVDFGKKGGVMIILPHWYWELSGFRRFVARVFWKIDEIAYNQFRKWLSRPEDAREFLPLTTGTVAVYTYSLKEWGHIMNLRFWGTTGKPHPNAKVAIGSVRKMLIEEGFDMFKKPFGE